MSIAENIKKIRLEHGLSQAELGKIAGVSDKAVSTWELGIKVPRMGAVEKMANYFGIAKSAIVDDVPTAPAPRPIPKGFEEMPEMVNLPVVGKIACGTPILAQQNIETYYQSPKEWRANMFLVCQGDSMEPFIKDGDMVAIREQQDAETDEIVAVMELDGCDGFATLKKLKKRPDRVELWPLNPEYEPIIYLKEEMNKLQIIGLAVGVIRRIHE